MIEAYYLFICHQLRYLYFKSNSNDLYYSKVTETSILKKTVIIDSSYMININENIFVNKRYK